MAQRGNQLERNRFCCSICLDLLKDPATLTCGHNFCMNCINNHWDSENVRMIYSCPLCRQTFRPRPYPMKNTMLADLVEELKKTEVHTASAHHCFTGALHNQVSAERTQRQKELERILEEIQQRVNSINVDGIMLDTKVNAANLSADKAVTDIDGIFTEMVTLLQKRHSELMQLIRFLHETQVSQIRTVQGKMQQEITELKKREAELKQLLNSEAHTQFLLNYHSLSALSPSTHSSTINVQPQRHFEDVTAAVAKVRGQLQDLLTETWTNLSLIVSPDDALLPEPEPKTRAEFLRYSQELTLDPNTVNKALLLSGGNRKVKHLLDQSYPDHTDRFTYYPQVLSKESLTGRCYWEVELSGSGVGVAVTYKNISRSGDSRECHFGFNEKSWVLDCRMSCFYHGGIKTAVSGGSSSRVSLFDIVGYTFSFCSSLSILGVYLDHRAGLLCFYRVSDTMTLIHRVQTRFTQPLYAGVRLDHYQDTVEFCKLK